MRPFRTVAVMFLAAGSLAFTASISRAANTANGADIYRQKCSMCHGMNGKGYAAIKTPNFTDPKWQAAHSDKELMNAIEDGVKGTAMVGFKGKLTHEQMTAVLKYIRSLGAKKK